MVELGHDSGDDRVQLVRFRVSTAELAVPAANVEEIVERTATTPIPGVPSHIPGIVALRGEAVPLLDVGAFLGLPASEGVEDRRARVLVVHVEPYRVGLVCDVVTGVAAVARSALESPRASQPASLRELSTAEIDLGHAVAAVLDLRRLLETARA